MPFSVPPGAVLGLMVAALFAGFVDAIAGGGGLFTLPALLAAGLPPHAALATNKGQAVFGAASSLASFWRRGAVDRALAPQAFVAGFGGSALGAWTVSLVSPKPLRPLVVGLLVIAAVLVLYPRSRARIHPGAEGRAGGILVAVLFLLGFYDGFFGPGVGTLLIVVLSSGFGQSFVRASGNAKVVNFASNAAALGIFLFQGTVHFRIALPMAGANALGALAGAKMAVYVGDRLVRVVAVVVLVALVLKLSMDLFGRQTM